MPPSDLNLQTRGPARPGPFMRVATAVLILLQALVMVAGPILDATVEAESSRSVVHIEGLNGTKCPSIHVGDCLVCRTLVSRWTMPSVTQPLTAVVSVSVTPPEDRVVQESRSITGTLRSRAPPGPVSHAFSA